MCFIFTRAIGHPPVSGPVCSCFSSPCRQSRQGSLFHSWVCSWSISWQLLLTGPYWIVVWSATCGIIYSKVKKQGSTLFKTWLCVCGGGLSWLYQLSSSSPLYGGTSTIMWGLGGHGLGLALYINSSRSLWQVLSSKAKWSHLFFKKFTLLIPWVCALQVSGF